MTTPASTPGATNRPRPSVCIDCNRAQRGHKTTNPYCDYCYKCTTWVYRVPQRLINHRTVLEQTREMLQDAGAPDRLVACVSKLLEPVYGMIAKCWNDRYYVPVIKSKPLPNTPQTREIHKILCGIVSGGTQ